MYHRVPLLHHLRAAPCGAPVETCSLTTPQPLKVKIRHNVQLVLLVLVADPAGTYRIKYCQGPALFTRTDSCYHLGSLLVQITTANIQGMLTGTTPKLEEGKTYHGQPP